MLPLLDTSDAHLAQLVQSLWGALDSRVAPWFRCTLRSSPDPRMAAVQIDWEILIEKHDRCVRGCRVEYPTRRFGARSVLTDRSVQLAQSPATILEGLRRSLCDEVRPLLYEYDPRIGDSWEQFTKPVPLFDPVPLHPPYWESAMQGLAPQPGLSCPLCKRPFNPLSTPMWGGGNVQWVHVDCWCRGEALDHPA